MAGVDKKKETAFGFTAIMLYCVAIALIGGGVYGYDKIPFFGKSNDKYVRPTTGKMLMVTEDRVRCQEYTFDNQTQQMTPGGLIYCNESYRDLDTAPSPPPSASGIRNAFGKR
jgi:hypothetical protein